jgi:hypothetical protein
VSGVDLVQWLTAQLDEDERVARACSGDGKWAERDIAIYGPHLGVEVLAHMARHDPARVLREIDAKRKMLDEVFIYEAKIDGEWGCCHDADEIAAGLCLETNPSGITAVRLLASAYADRPGYREEWAS